PGELTCVDCHDSFDLDRGPGRVEILGLPKIYTPNQRITVRVNVSQAKQKRWGFEITALDANNQPAGQFVITDAVNTQRIAGDGGRSYVEHTAQGSSPGKTGGMEWSFDWIAPSADIGAVIFYAAGNAANNSNSPIGDYIYTTVAQLNAPSDPVVTLSTPDG